jgi:multidrug efflux pump subunit AcrA (membrane-fusion protein)
MILKQIVMATFLAASGPERPGLTIALPDQPVQAQQPKQEKRDAIEIAGCRIIPFESVEIFPQVSGMLRNVKVDIGDRVKKGDVLAEIDAPELVADLEQAGMAVNLARAKIDLQKMLLQKAEAERRIAELIVQQREADLLAVKGELLRAEEEFNRFAQPAKDVAAKVDIARARFGSAKIAVELAVMEKDARSATVKAVEQAAKIEDIQHKLARVGEHKARILVERTRLLATVDGIVTVRKFDAGVLLSAKNALPIVKLARMDVMRLIIPVPAAQAAKVKKGTRVIAIVKMSPENKVVGAVARISPVIDEKSGTMRVEVDLPNPNGRILEGMAADVRIELGAVNPSKKAMASIGGSP